MSLNDDDQPSMQEAIQESLRAWDSNQATQSTYQITEELDPPIQTCQNRVNIDDRIHDMTMQAAIELPIIHDPQGNTFIYIDAPQRQPEQDEYDYERYIKRYDAPILMHSDTLTRYSPVLARLFGPTLQYRFLRRRKLANRLPSHVKYVIDLTPPSEGEGTSTSSLGIDLELQDDFGEQNSLFAPKDCHVNQVFRLAEARLTPNSSQMPSF